VAGLTLHATGPAAPDEVWERYAVLGRWPSWAPQITGVDVAGPTDGRLRTGLRGRVRGPLGIAVPFVVEDVDERARRWVWTVRAGPLRLRLVHWVAPAPDGGSTTGLRLRGPAPVLAGYAPLASWALHRLVG
jgi:polyketide cyclase/dehydrase/lipid transport protein